MDESVGDAPAPARRRRPRRHGALLAGFAVLLAVIAVPVVAALVRDDDSHSRKVRTDTDADGTQQVLAALAATMSSGSYDLDFTFHIEPGNPAVACTLQESSPVEFAAGTACGTTATTDVSGTGTVNTAPYAMTVDTDVSSLGSVGLHVNGTTVWEVGGADYGTGPGDAQPGRSLSGFAGLVEGTLGQGQGALTMISLANNSGYLGLESEAIVAATTDGDGTLADGTHLRYFRTNVDITKMADADALTDEQRQAITDAVGVLQSAGYTGSEERIGIDDAGFIREVTATTTFADGSSMVRHSRFTNFGCAPHVTMPNELPDTTPTGPCAAPTTTTPPPTTTTVPSPTTTTILSLTTTTGVEATSTTTVPPTTTSAEAPTASG